MRYVKTLAVIATACAALATAGCGRTDSSGASGQTSGGAATGDGTGTVTLWAMGAEGEALTDFIKPFTQAHPDITVNVTPIPWASAHDKLQTAIAGGSVPDIAQMGTTWMADFADAFVEVPTDIDTSDLFEGPLETGKVDGTQLGVPWYVDTRVIYYRTDIAHQAGWDKAPATWDELHQMAADLQKVDGVDFGIYLQPSGMDAFQGALWAPWSAGASLTNEDGSAWTLDTPEMAKGLEYFASFFTDGIADPDADTSPGASVANFVSGTVPMSIDGPSGGAQINELGGEGFEDKYATAVLPTEVSATSFVGGSNLVVFKQAQNQSAAWELAKWLLQPDVQAAWYTATTDLPASQSAWQDPALAGSDKLKAFGDQLNDTKAPPSVPTWAEVGAAGDTIIERITKGSESVPDGLAELQAQADSIGMK